MKRTYFAMLVFLVSVSFIGQNPDANKTNGMAVQEQPPIFTLPSPHRQTDFTPLEHHSLSWDKGYLASFGNGEPVTLYDKHGAWIFAAPLTFDGAVNTYVHHAAPTASGTAVVSASVVDRDGVSADLIVEVGKAGISRAIRTSPFYAFRVCSTGQGTVWAYGKELTDDRAAEPRTHYPMLREYSFDKGQLRSEIDRATVRPPNGVPIVGKVPYDIQLRCGSGKVVIISIPTNEVIEYDLATSKLNRWPMALQPDGFQITGAALTDSGEIYVSSIQGGRGKSTAGMFRLNLSSTGTADWVPLTVTPDHDKLFHLVGADGDDLVYSQGLRSPTLFWSATPRKEMTK